MFRVADVMPPEPRKRKFGVAVTNTPEGMPETDIAIEPVNPFREETKTVEDAEPVTGTVTSGFPNATEKSVVCNPTGATANEVVEFPMTNTTELPGLAVAPAWTVSVEKAVWLPVVRVAVGGDTVARTPLGTLTVLKFTVPMKLLTPEILTNPNVV